MLQQRLISWLFAAIVLLTPQLSHPCSLASQFLTIPYDGDVLVARNGKILFAFSPPIQFEFTPKLTFSGQEVLGKITDEKREALYNSGADNYLTSYSTFETDEPLRPNTLYTFELVLNDPKDWVFSEPPKIEFVTGDFFNDSPPEFQKIEIQRVSSREGYGSAACDYWGVHNEVELGVSLAKNPSEEPYLFYTLFLTKEEEEPNLEKPFRILESRDFVKNDLGAWVANFDFSETETKNYKLSLYAEDIHGYRSPLVSAVFTSVSKDASSSESAVPLLSTSEASEPASTSCTLNKNQSQAPYFTFLIFSLVFCLVLRQRVREI